MNLRRLRPDRVQPAQHTPRPGARAAPGLLAAAVSFAALLMGYFEPDLAVAMDQLIALCGAGLP